MELHGKLEVYLELNCNIDKFFKLFSSQIHHVCKASSDKVHSIKVHEGDWETTGSIKLWTYTINGKPEVCKERTDIDVTNKSITLTALEGHVLEQYKSYKVTLQAVPKNGRCLVTVSLDYEKFKADDPRPNHYLDFIIIMVHDTDAHLANP